MIRPAHGFALVTVALVLLVTASVALLLTTEIGMGRHLLNSEKERAELQYITEAGLAHARWQLAQNTTCASYAPLPATSFGGHSYNASFDPDNGSPVSISLTGKHTSGVLHTVTMPESKVYEAPIAVPLQLGTDPGKDVLIDRFYDMSNYGGSDYITIRSDPGWTQRVLLEFNVSAVPSGVKIISADLELKQNSVGTPGAIVVHRVTRSWEEGTGLGTGNADGANWLEYDGANLWAQPGGEFDSTLYGSANITSASNGQWATWDVRELVEGWVSGQFSNQGLILVGDGVVNAANFDSQEASDPTNAPKLTITYACECGAGESGTIDLQPGGAGEDTYIADATPTTNWGADTEIRISEKTNSKGRGLMRFDVSSLPPVATVVSAVLTINLEGIGSGGTATIFLHEATSPWLEHQATWNDAQTGSPWSTAGGDYDSTPVTSAAIDAVVPGPTNFVITNLVQGWVDNPATNQGFVLVGSDGVNHADFTTGESTDSSLQPKLSISYTCPCGAGCGAGPTPPGGDKLLLVVSSDTAPTATEDARRTLIESWGYTVALIDDNDAQSTFDAALAANDVVYVTSTISFNALTGKLNTASNGIVSEHEKFAKELGFSDATTAGPTTSDIQIVDNTHYITNGFPLGSLSIFNAAQTTRTLTGTMSPGLSSLGEATGAKVLDALDVGATRYDATPSPGKRVVVPWGSSGFDPAVLTGDGELIMQRAIEWATTPPPPPLNVLLVVGNAATLSNKDAGRKTLMESWGFTVNVIDDGDSQANFDTATADADVVYVTASIGGGALADKLTGNATAVVNEFYGKLDNFGFSSQTGATVASADTFTKTDAGHFVTSPFSGNAATVFTSGLSMPVPSGTLASGLQNLGEVSGTLALVSLDTGAARWDGNPAPARRVHLPFGSAETSQLTTDGEEVMRRAIEWGAGSGGGGGGGGGGGSGLTFEEFTEGRNTTGVTTGVTIAKPGGTATGDLLVVAVATDGDTSATLAPPPGWSLNSLGMTGHDGSGAVTFGVWWKIADGTEPAEVTFDWSPDAEQAYGWMMRFTGHDPSSPIATAAVTTGNSISPLSTNLITGTDDNLILRLAGFDDDDITLDDPGLAGHNAITMDRSNTGVQNTVSGGAGYIIQSTAGDTGTENYALTGKEQYRSITVAIRPAP